MASNRLPRSQWVKNIQSFQAKHNEKRTLSERLADQVTISSGTISFLLINISVFASWILLNLGILGTIKPFDPFPFPLLTTLLSIEAIVLAIFVLISQNRAMKMQDLRQEVNLQIDLIAEQEITKLITLVRGLYDALDINLDDDPELKEMVRPTDKEQIEEELKQQIEPEKVES